MDRKQWLKDYRNCKHKFAARDDYPVTGKHGNLMCGAQLPFGIRCMFKKCPLIQREAILDFPKQEAQQA